MNNASRVIRISFLRRITIAIAAGVFLLVMLTSAVAQSSDQAIPTPVRAADISATIPVRDLGDPRRTQHFFIFTGTPGDLSVTVESRNLNGDVDVFTAGNFRPLFKISLFAGDTSGRTSKSVYLRARQDLILRVEARSPNDEQGTYRIQFGGSFEPFSGEIAGAETPTEADDTAAAAATSPRKGKRVNAVGARIDEPVVEEKASSEPLVTETPAPEPPKPEPPRSARNRPGRRNPRTTRSRPAPKPKPAETTEGEAKSGEPARTDEPSAPAASETQVELGPRLIIETKEGTRIERSMSTVRRVVVDNGQIVVILRTGKIERTPLNTIVRMSIEP